MRNNPVMETNRIAQPFFIAVALAALLPTALLAANVNYVHIAVPSPLQAITWYTQYLDCEAISDRDNAVNCSGIEIVFETQAVLGGSQGTGLDHISFSVPDLAARMAEIEVVGVGGMGVRLQRFDDGATFRDIPDFFKVGFIFDPWGTSIELVEDPDHLGFHHIHLSSVDPEATLVWYQDVFGGEPALLKGLLDGLLFDDIWLLVSEHEEATPASTQGRVLDHVGFVVPDLEAFATQLREQGVEFQQEPVLPENGRSKAKRAFLMGPDNVRLAVVEAGWAGLNAELTPTEKLREFSESYVAPQTPWGEPDLQGIWTGDAAHGIPLERPLDIPEAEELTQVEAAARRERGTLRSIWGYEREWRDTTLGYAKTAPLTQIAMIIDPPDGRLPPLTPNAEALAAAGGNRSPSLPAGPEDLNSWVRCITQGLPNLMMPTVYNNGLQIIQSPGIVAIQKEMIHETRVIPIDGPPHLGPGLTQWLGDSRGWWEGDTLVVEVTNFNGRVAFRGSSENMKLTERFTRVAPNLLEYEFTVDDPTVWTQPWTAVFPFVKDDDQYELIEYACHEGNYGMANILSGARASEQAIEEATQ